MSLASFHFFFQYEENKLKREWIRMAVTENAVLLVAGIEGAAAYV
jgi:hypothetical protein